MHTPFAIENLLFIAENTVADTDTRYGVLDALDDLANGIEHWFETHTCENCGTISTDECYRGICYKCLCDEEKQRPGHLAAELMATANRLLDEDRINENHRSLSV